MRIKTKIALAATAWAAASAALGATVNFAYTGAAQTWTVPAGVTQVTLELRGAQGGGSYLSGAGTPRQEDGGLGGLTQGTLAVTPGQVLNLYVGGQAPDVGNITPAPGGFNGGGDGGQWGAGGGGATDVRVGGIALANRVAVAGGGGGGNSGGPDHGTGGAGGGVSGDPGVNLSGGYAPGGGGTQAAGGTAGSNPGGVAGQLGLGGSSASYHVAGGGGGYYGGGSAFAAGGGGGSGYVGGLTGGTTTAGVQAGHGSITITYNVAIAPVPTLETGALALLGAALAALGAAGAARRRRG